MYWGNKSGRRTPAGTLALRTTVEHTARAPRGLVSTPKAHVEALYAEHRGAAFALAYRMLGERGLAEDVVQEAFLNIWRQGVTYDTERGTARTWLLTIVHHRAIDLMRRQRAKAGADTVIDAAVPLPSGEDTWATVAEHLESDRIRKAVATLPPEQQQVIVLSYFGGLTHAEIAARVGVPLGTVKGRLRLAMEKLRVALSAEMQAEGMGQAA
jgi:RNA polymerase sigma-70 factor (ECF subfamily)